MNIMIFEFSKQIADPMEYAKELTDPLRGKTEEEKERLAAEILKKVIGD